MKEFIEKLISRLEEYRYNTGESIINLGERKAIYKISDIIDELAEEYSADTPQKSAGGWIICSEKQPNKDGYYLVTTSDGEIDVREYGYSKGWGWDGFERIIAWQPLPELYEEEKPAEWKDAVMNHFTKIE